VTTTKYVSYACSVVLGGSLILLKWI